MSFRAQLEAVVEQVDGALGCTIMGFDGIAVESHQLPATDDLDLSGAWVEFANVLNQLKQTFSAFRTGQVNELIINADGVIAVIRSVSSEAFLALALRQNGHFFQSRYL